MGPFIHDFISRRVGHLPRPSEPRGRGREEDEEAEVVGVGAERGEQAAQAGDLGVVDRGELGVGLVLDPAVGQHPRRHKHHKQTQSH